MHQHQKPGHASGTPQPSFQDQSPIQRSKFPPTLQLFASEAQQPLQRKQGTSSSGQPVVQKFDDEKEKEGGIDGQPVVQKFDDEKEKEGGIDGQPVVQKFDDEKEKEGGIDGQPVVQKLDLEEEEKEGGGGIDGQPVVQKKRG